MQAYMNAFSVAVKLSSLCKSLFQNLLVEKYFIYLFR